MYGLELDHWRHEYHASLLGLGKAAAALCTSPPQLAAVAVASLPETPRHVAWRDTCYRRPSCNPTIVG